MTGVVPENFSYTLSLLFPANSEPTVEQKAMGKIFISQLNSSLSEQWKANGAQFIYEHITSFMEHMADRAGLGLTVLIGENDRYYFVFHMGCSDEEIEKTIEQFDAVRLENAQFPSITSH